MHGKQNEVRHKIYPRFDEDEQVYLKEVYPVFQSGSQRRLFDLFVRSSPFYCFSFSTATRRNKKNRVSHTAFFPSSNLKHCTLPISHDLGFQQARETPTITLNVALYFLLFDHREPGSRRRVYKLFTTMNPSGPTTTRIGVINHKRVLSVIDANGNSKPVELIHRIASQSG